MWHRLNGGRAPCSADLLRDRNERQEWKGAFPRAMRATTHCQNKSHRRYSTQGRTTKYVFKTKIRVLPIHITSTPRWPSHPLFDLNARAHSHSHPNHVQYYPRDEAVTKGCEVPRTTATVLIPRRYHVYHQGVSSLADRSVAHFLKAHVFTAHGSKARALSHHTILSKHLSTSGQGGGPQIYRHRRLDSAGIQHPSSSTHQACTCTRARVSSCQRQSARAFTGAR